MEDNINLFLSLLQQIKLIACFAFIMSKERSIDIDDEFDFKLAEAILRVI